MSEIAIIAKNASSLRLVILTYGRVPIITRRVRTLSFEENFARHSAFSSRRLSPLGPKPFEGFLPSVCDCAFGAGEHDCTFLSTIASVAETARVSSRTLSFCLSLRAFSHSALNADFCPFLTLGHHSCSNPFVPSFEVVRPNHLINMSCH